MIRSVPATIGTVRVSPRAKTATSPANKGVVFRRGDAREIPTFAAEMKSRICVAKGDKIPASVKIQTALVGACPQSTSGPSIVERIIVDVNREKVIAVVGVPWLRPMREQIWPEAKQIAPPMAMMGM